MFSEQYLCEYQSERVDVGFMVDGLVLQLFDGRVGKRTVERNKALLVLVELDRDAKISDFEDFIFDKYVVGFEIVMDDLFAPEQAVASKQVLDDYQELCQVKLPACPFAGLNEVGESGVIAVLHDQVVIVIGDDLERINFDYVLALLVGFIPTSRGEVVDFSHV